MALLEHQRSMAPRTPRATLTVMAYWLIKSEPHVFAYADLERVQVEPWNGVRNYQARNFLRQMQVGDLCLFYHSNAKPAGVVGVARVVRAAYADDLQFDPDSEYFDPRSDTANPRWSMVDVEPLQVFPRLLPLAEMRELAQWQTSPLVRKGNRLSVLPVSSDEFAAALGAVGLTVDLTTQESP